LLAPIPAFGQDAPSQPTGGDIVVIGNGLPVPPGMPAYDSTVIDRDRLTGDASGRVEDVMLDVAGLQQFRRSDSRSANPSAQGITVRALGGNAASRTLVLLDGVPQADPFFGYIPFNAIQPDQLGAIRVTRGGGAGPFGAGALSGTVDMTSATRADLPLVDASAFYGSRNAQQLSADVTPDVGSGYVSLFGNFDRGDGFYTTPLDQRVAASARARYRDWSAGLRAAAPIDAETELQARAIVFRDDRVLRFQGADNGSDGEDASLRLIHRGPWQVDALAYVQARNFTAKTISSTSYLLTLDQRNTPSTGIGGKIELRPPVGGGYVLQVGVDTRFASGELFEDPYAATGLPTSFRHAGGRQVTTGAFVEDSWTFGRLTLTGGARIDHWTISGGFYDEISAAGAQLSNIRYADRDGTAGTGRAGAVYRLSKVLAVRAAAYTGFRLPTLNELYRPFTIFPILTEANAALKLERLKGTEAGVDLTPARGVTLGLTAFWNQLDDAIANVTIGTNLRERENVDAIIAKGIEASAAIQRGSWSLGASYAFNASRVHAPGAALDGMIPAQSPRQVASATLAYGRDDRPGASVTARYVGLQYEDDLEANPMRAAFTIDGVVHAPLTRHVTLIGRVENLFNETVITRNQSGSIDLGTPQTFWIGVRWH
jgi:iron complex outermembrane receptor protein